MGFDVCTESDKDGCSREVMVLAIEAQEELEVGMTS